MRSGWIKEAMERSEDGKRIRVFTGALLRCRSIEASSSATVITILERKPSGIFNHQRARNEERTLRRIHGI